MLILLLGTIDIYKENNSY